MKETTSKVDGISINLAISEEDWVYRILKESFEPLNTKEIAEKKASFFI